MAIGCTLSFGQEGLNRIVWSDKRKERVPSTWKENDWMLGDPLQPDKIRERARERKGILVIQRGTEKDQGEEKERNPDSASLS